MDNHDTPDEIGARGDLTRLVFALAGPGVAYFIASMLLSHSLARGIKSGQFGLIFRVGYPGLLIIYTLAMLAAILSYGPRRASFRWEKDEECRSTHRLLSIGLGIAGGLACCAIAVPVMLTQNEGIILAINPVVSIHGLLQLFLLVIAIPFTSEIVFRGMVFRRLAEHMTLSAAVIASTALFMMWWPVLGWYAAASLGLVSAGLFRKTGTLTASITASAVLSLGSTVLILLFGYRQ